jgi:hypothetical protein
MLRHHLNETPPIKEDGDKEAKIAERGLREQIPSFKEFG